MKRFTCVLLFLILVNIVSVQLSFDATPSAIGADSTQSRFKVKQRVLFSDTPSVWAFALVTNEGTEPVTNVSVTFTFWDNTGSVINQNVTKTYLQTILPNRTAPVSASISYSDAVRYGDMGGWCEVNVSSYDVYPEEVETVLVVNPQATYLTEAEAYIQGTVINNGSGTVRAFQVFAMFYDEEGFRTFEAYQELLQSELEHGGETTFEIDSIFATNASEKLACVLTAESPRRTGQAAYEADREMLIWLKGGPETEGLSFDLRWVVLAAILVIVVLAGVTLMRRRWQKKTRRPKEAVTKARVLEPTDFYFATTTILSRYTQSAYLGLRGLGCKVFGWSVTILGTA